MNVVNSHDKLSPWRKHSLANYVNAEKQVYVIHAVRQTQIRMRVHAARFFVSTACKSTFASVLFQSTHLHSYDGLSLGEAYKATDTAVVQFYYHRFAALSKLLNNNVSV